MIMSMAPLMDILRAAAKASSWSQAEICRALGLSRPHVSQFYAGTKGLSVAASEKLAAFLGLEIVARPLVLRGEAPLRRVAKTKDKTKPKTKKRGK